MYLRRRLGARPPGRFVEVGTGEGDLARLLVELGWVGVGYEPGAVAASRARTLNADAIASGTFELREADWLQEHDVPRVDLFVSSMVLEHLSDDGVARLLAQAEQALTDDGLGVVLVPASPRHWGIEDEIAGHLRRYTRATLTETLRDAGFETTHLAGLTYPISNVLLPLSNRQVGRWEDGRRQLDLQARTSVSGSREVPWKTRFPSVAGIFLNEKTLSPLYALQLLTRDNERSLVLYAEWARSGARADAMEQ
jgi:SAM-dependent methyltransferase